MAPIAQPPNAPQGGGGTIKSNDWRNLDVQYYNGTFVVAEYRRPEFQVNVTAAKDEVLQGETVEVNVEATYFFGGAVGGAPVNWSVTASDYYFDRYHGPGYYGWNDIDYGGINDGSRGGLIASGEGKTDAQGKLKITLPAKLDEKTGSQRFSIEAAVTDLNGQYVANRVSVIVHQGQYYIGSAQVDYVGTQGKPMDFNLLTVDWQGGSAGNKSLDVVFYQREWYNVQEKDDFGNIMWTWSFSDTAVFTATATTGVGDHPALLMLPIPSFKCGREKRLGLRPKNTLIMFSLCILQ